MGTCESTSIATLRVRCSLSQPRFQAQRSVQPDAIDQHRTAVVIVGRICVALHVEGGIEAFPYPVYLKWFTNFRTEYPGTQIISDAIGSEAGVRKLLAVP